MYQVHIGFVRAQTCFERFVARITAGAGASSYCHCELAISDGSSSTHASTALAMPVWSSYWGEGVRKSVTNDTWHRTRTWSWFTVCVTDNAAIQQMRAFLDNNVHKPYDYSGFCLWVLPACCTPKSNDNAYFCSELCASALEILGVHLGRDSRKISPNMLFQLLSQQHLLVPDTAPGRC